MIIGHFAVAFLLIWLFPQVPFWVPLVGVSFPDLLWGVLLLAGREQVSADRSGRSPNGLDFRKYPYSHSLVTTNVISLILGSVMAAATGDAMVAPVFVLASVSHWVLDALVHTPDLPVLGFGRDRKVGLGLWRWGRTFFFVELAVYIGAAAVFLPLASLPLVGGIGLVFHAINAPATFKPKRPVQLGSPRSLAGGALVLFGALSAILAFVI